MSVGFLTYLFRKDFLPGCLFAVVVIKMMLYDWRECVMSVQNISSATALTFSNKVVFYVKWESNQKYFFKRKEECLVSVYFFTCLSSFFSSAESRLILSKFQILSLKHRGINMAMTSVVVASLLTFILCLQHVEGKNNLYIHLITYSLLINSGSFRRTLSF